MKKSHPQVEFEVSMGERTKNVKTFAEASELALHWALSGRQTVIDILVFSESGARWLGGDDAVEQYREDPDASVFERIEVRAHTMGRIP
jgi:hypothetical protein